MLLLFSPPLPPPPIFFFTNAVIVVVIVVVIAVVVVVVVVVCVCVTALLLLGDNDDDDNAAIVAADALEGSLRAMVEGQMRYANDASKSRPRTKNMGDDDNVNVARGQPVAQGRKIRRRRQAQLSLSKPLSEEEIEARRIRFIYVAHLG